MFDPRIYSLLIFKTARGREKKLIQSVLSRIKTSGDGKVEVTYKEGWTIIEVCNDIMKKGAEYSKVSPDIFKLKYEENRKLLRRAKEIVTPYLNDGREPHSYNIFTCGSNDRAWMGSPNDISFFYMEKKVNEDENFELQKNIYQSNISYLNRMMNRTDEIIVNSIKTSTVSALLYALGRKSRKGEVPLPSDILLEIDMGAIDTKDSYRDKQVELSGGSPYDSEDSGEREGYLNRQNYLINLLALKSKILEILLLQSEVIDHMKGEIAEGKLKGSKLKDEIFEMQNKINTHMKNYMPKPSKKGGKMDFLDKETYEDEKSLLTGASVQFSLISEVEHEIMRFRSKLMDLNKKIMAKTRSINLQSEDYSTDTASGSFQSRISDQIEGEYRTLENMMSELSHSRDILSSNIDVLRTFIDTRQREVSEDMSRLMNLLFLVFACIGLADALGNFVILALEYGYLQDKPDLYTVVEYSSLGLGLTLIPLLVAALFLYYYFKKR